MMMVIMTITMVKMVMMMMMMMMVHIVWEEAIGRRGVVSPADTQRVPHPPRGAL